MYEHKFLAAIITIVEKFSASLIRLCKIVKAD